MSDSHNHSACAHCELLARWRALRDQAKPANAEEETALFRTLFDLTLGGLAEVVAEADDPEIRAAWARRVTAGTPVAPVTTH